MAYNTCEGGGSCQSQLISATGSASQSPTSTPTHTTMTRVRQFVVDLAKAGKRFKEIDETVKKVYGDKAMTYSAIYKILRQVKAGGDTSDRRRSNSKKTKRTLAHIASIAAAVDDDRRISVKRLALMHDLSVGTVFTILDKDLSLS